MRFAASPAVLLVSWAAAASVGVRAMQAQPFKQMQVALATATRGDENSVFVAVFSRRTGGWRRDRIRAMWRHAQKLAGESLTVKFALCRGAGTGETPWYNQSLEAEQASKGDMVFLECNDGYGHGELTRRLIGAMKLYVRSYRNKYFMKIDDDTFISWKRYAERLRLKGGPKLYMGVEIGEGKPCRNESYPWYESYATYPDELFPKAMAGGSGYTLGRDLVDIVVKTGLGEDNLLFNEDRAVGFWMDKIVKTRRPVDYVSISGIDGYWAWDWGHPTEAFTTWGRYPYAIHHGLEALTIECLYLAELTGRDDHPIGECFTPEVGKTFRPILRDPVQGVC